MKINELILELQKKAEEYGDVEVFCQSDVIGPVLEITPVGYLDVGDERDGEFILLSFDKLEDIPSENSCILDDNIFSDDTTFEELLDL